MARGNRLSGAADAAGLRKRPKKRKSKTDTVDWQPTSESSPAKYRTLQQVALLVRQEQKDFLDSLENEATVRRQAIIGMTPLVGGKPVEKDRRITKNTFIRCLIDVLQERHSELNLDRVINEDDLRERLRKLFSK